MHIVMSCFLFLYETQSLRWVDHDSKSDECNLDRIKWGMLIDGKDANLGEFAYGQSFSKHMQQALDLVLNMRNNEEISVQSIIDLQSSICGQPFRYPDQNYMFELPCLQKANNPELKRDILADLPPEIVDVHYLEDHEGRQTLDWVGIKNGLSRDDIKMYLKHIVDTYNDVGIEKNSSYASSKEKLIALAKFLRSLAWLHPFADCNGRTRNLLLQKELRRLNLGCGAMMFNNNADIYVSTTTTYVAKMEEGLLILNRAMKSNSNPWTQDDVVKAHIGRFPIPEQLEKCRSAFLNNQKDVALENINPNLQSQNHVRAID